jgi:hypothetical protein
MRNPGIRKRKKRKRREQSKLTRFIGRYAGKKD